MIAPSHGVLWRDNPLQIVEKYQDWARQEPENRAVLLYDTMWGATRRMAEAIGDGLGKNGLPYKLIDLAVSDHNDALVEVFRAKWVGIGSPTFNGDMLPSVSGFLTAMKGLKFQNTLCFAFGSYGWSGEGVKKTESRFQEAGLDIAAEGISCKWQPDSKTLENCRNFGEKLSSS